MLKKQKKNDRLFIILTSAALLYYIIFLFTYPYLYDEPFYVTIPHRIINGDSLINDEWHLSQFSSLFTFLPVWLWTTVTGSTDGIFIFLRCIYLLIHTSVSVIVYKNFRKYSVWAVFASLMFFTQTPYRLLSLSYNSVFPISLLLMSLYLLRIYETPSPSNRTYIVAGIFFGCCCVCNPLFSLSFLFYLVICAVRAVAKKRKEADSEEKKPSDRLFSGSAILYSLIGILSVAAVTVVYFLLTGGTFNAIWQDISCMLSNSEYKLLDSDGILWKFRGTLDSFNLVSLHMPFLLPLLFGALIFDKKRKLKTHRVIYLAASFIIAIIYIIGTVRYVSFNAFVPSFPFAIFSITCYILTNNKNKPVFYCMWLICAVAAVFQYFAANTQLSAINIVFSVSNVAGVLFVKDLFSELVPQKEDRKEKTISKSCRAFVCIILCLQIVFHLFVIQYDQLPQKGSRVATDGPYAGIFMSEERYSQYSAAMSDINTLKEISDPDAPVLIMSFQSWMYLEADRPYAVNTTWYRGHPIPEILISYYKQNPEKIPAYIYCDYNNYYNEHDEFIIEMSLSTFELLFSYTEKELESGILLTVTDFKFD